MAAPIASNSAPIHPFRRWRRRYFLPCLLVGSVASFLFSRQFLFSTVIVVGQSMVPTLQEGDRCFVNHWQHRLQGFHRGDLLVVNEPGSNIVVVKRLIALPGDTLQLRDDGVYLNGHRLQEPYVHANGYTYSRRLGNRTMTLGAEEFFVLGDNRLISVDSRWYGPVPRNRIRGTIRR